nr:hypothetical protein [Candidatus Sigynarchaeota archaeon]
MPQVEDVRLAIQYARWALPFLVRLQNERLVLQAFTRFQHACISLPEIISFMESQKVSATAANHAINRLRQQGWIARLDPASDLGIVPRYKLVTIQTIDRTAIDKMLDAAGAVLAQTEEHIRFVDRNRGSFLQNPRAAIYKAPRGGVQSQKPSGLLSFTDQEEADAIAKGNDIREQKIKEAKPVIKKDLDYADWLMQNGDFRLAIDIINRVVATDKKNKRALIMSWECQAELGLLPDMLRTLKVLAELDPESHVFVHNLGAGYMVARKWSKAETYLRRAMAISHAPETRAELERIEVLKTAHDTQVPIPFMYIGYAGPLAVFQSRARIFHEQMHREATNEMNYYIKTSSSDAIIARPCAICHSPVRGEQVRLCEDTAKQLMFHEDIPGQPEGVLLDADARVICVDCARIYHVLLSDPAELRRRVESALQPATD